MLDTQNFDVAQVAKDIWGRGYAIFPLPGDAVDAVQAVRQPFRHITEMALQLPEQTLSGVREGEREADIGLIHRAGGQHDQKWFMHYDQTSAQTLQSLFRPLPAGDDFLLKQAVLYQQIAKVGYAITTELDAQYGLRVAELYRQSCSVNALAFAAATLRSLLYPTAEASTGAKRHQDMCFLTIHLGDEGGQLWAEVEGKEVPISPPPGHAVAFFGVRVLWVTGGDKKPLPHWSTMDGNADREAFVFFGNVPLSLYRVRSNKDASHDFYDMFLPEIQAGRYRWDQSF